MGWVRVDDAFYDHSKWVEAGPLGAGWWVTALAWSNRNLTDGFIPNGVVERLCSFDGLSWQVGGIEGLAKFHDDVTGFAVAERLCDLGILEPREGGYQIHDYLVYQASREQVLTKREKEKERWHRRADSTRTGEATTSTLRGNSAASCDVPNPNPKEEPFSSERREDVDTLCDLLADLVAENTGKRPTITNKWRTEARLLLDKDQVPLAEAERIARWACNDSFWRSNILGMPKFREKFAQLRLKAPNANGHLREAPPVVYT